MFEVGLAVSILVTGISAFLVSIPALLIGGAVIIVCLIGRSAIKREQTTRIKDICLHMEHSLIEMKRSFNQINDCMQRLPRKEDFNEDNLNDYLPIFEELKTAITHLPSREKFEELVNKFRDENLFDVNIRHQELLNTAFRLSVEFYIDIDALSEKINAQEYDRDILILADDFKNRCWVKEDNDIESMFYKNMGDGAEFWRQNIAVLRPSLT